MEKTMIRTTLVSHTYGKDIMTDLVWYPTLGEAYTEVLTEQYSTGRKQKAEFSFNTLGILQDFFKDGVQTKVVSNADVRVGSRKSIDIRVTSKSPLKFEAIPLWHFGIESFENESPVQWIIPEKSMEDFLECIERSYEDMKALQEFIDKNEKRD